MTHGPARPRLAQTRAAVLSVLLALGAALVLTGSPAAATPAAMPDASIATAHDITAADHTAHAPTMHAAVREAASTATPQPLTCATCGTEQHEAMAACSLMLFAVALLALPFVTRRRWNLPLLREAHRSVGRLTWTPRTPDLTALCVLRT
ncbi:hypothetical protein [Demequina sp. NBRC 110052]|uniref:hypothetical protein n=1 Tax=Demequina sp. NBRC 110052 TaxID=1570341 RepID=UPI000A01CB82|nr:hypothetical protein [Demequina sp. NBRC 110052]